MARGAGVRGAGVLGATGLVEPPGAGVAQGGVGVFLAGGAGVALGAGVLPMRLATLLGE